MELNKHTKSDVIDFLNILNKMHKLERDAWQVQKRYTSTNELPVIDFYGTLDTVYQLLVNEKRNYVHDLFECPAFAKTSKKPVAWYRTQFNSANEYIKGSYSLTGFIPDAIDNIILHDKRSGEVKYKILVKCFKDLIKLESGK